jgi:hypothetical protein
VGCVVALLGLVLPRFTLFLLWLFTERLDRAFDSFLVGFLGFLLLPYTTLLYALVYDAQDGVTGIGWFLVIVGFFFDLASLTNGHRERERARSFG